jgi:DNA-binding transcriptional ArsR family regulator
MRYCDPCVEKLKPLKRVLGSETIMEIYYVIKDIGYPCSEEILDRIYNKSPRRLRDNLRLLRELDLILRHKEGNKRSVFYVRPGKLEEYYEKIRKI